MSVEQLIPLRLAFRLNGDRVNVFLAKPGTMEDAVLVGSLALELAAEADNWLEFQDFMKRATERAGLMFP